MAILLHLSHVAQQGPPIALLHTIKCDVVTLVVTFPVMWEDDFLVSKVKHNWTDRQTQTCCFQCDLPKTADTRVLCGIHVQQKMLP